MGFFDKKSPIYREVLQILAYMKTDYKRTDGGFILKYRCKRVVYNLLTYPTQETWLGFTTTQQT